TPAARRSSPAANDFIQRFIGATLQHQAHSYPEEGMRASLVLAWFFVVLPAQGAGPYSGHDLARFSFAERHMGTKFEIICYARSGEEARQAAKAGFARVTALNAIMSDYLE